MFERKGEMAKHFDREQIQRVARIYHTNVAAAAALGIAPGSFGRLCRRYEVETPLARRKRKLRETTHD